MKDIELKLTQDEVNTILFALSEMPYKQVFQLVGKIQKQGNEQLKETADA